jgi:hypothetical protein
VDMSSCDHSADCGGPIQPLQYNLALLANLIYLARRAKEKQQQRYLDWAANVVEEMQHHPKVRE